MLRKSYAHVILFQCPQCQSPLASAFSSMSETMETTETMERGQFSAVCRCGWMGNGLGSLVVNKSVQAWESACEPAPEQHDAPSDECVITPRDWLFRVAKQISSLGQMSSA